MDIDGITSELDDNKKEHRAIMEKLDDFGKQLTAIRVELASLPERILEKADSRYASKTTEKALYTLIGAVTLGVVYSILRQVVK